jgi:hypothetical protein
MKVPTQQTVEAEKQQVVASTCKLKTRLIQPATRLCQCLGQCRMAWHSFLATNRNIGLADDCTPSTLSLKG